MEPQSHRLDREAMLADHEAVAERVRRDVDEMVAAAAEKRHAHFDQVIDHLRSDVDAQQPTAVPDGEAARLLVAAAHAAEDVREASHARALQTLTQARERAEQIDAETERRSAALAEMEERCRQAEHEAGEILAGARAEAESVVAALEEGRRARVDREAEAILAGARVEAERVAAAIEEERRGEIEREANEILARTRAEAEQAVTAIEEDRRQAERDADEIRAQARDEAQHVVAAIEEERRRVRELLTGAIATLDAEAAPQPDNIVGDLSSRLQETREPTST